jgi:hypothetical protein
VVRHLRIVENCDVVIEIKHMRLAEDFKVSQATHDDCRVDLFLGGHDHETVCRLAGNTCSDPARYGKTLPMKRLLRVDVFQQ